MIAQKYSAAWDAIQKKRQICRTDLLALCKVIGYADVCEEVHGEIIRKLQKFPGGRDELLSDASIKYTPLQSLWTLEGSKRNLYLDPRGHLKTTIITQAHIIQWILNYPDIRVLITTATGDLAEKVIRAIKAPFQFNEQFRALFPDFCPADGKVADWGNMEAFTVPARRDMTLREPTCSTSSVGKTIAGSHYEVLKCSDMVDKENVKTPGGIRDVIEHFRYMDPLLERKESPTGPKRGWTDVEGTRYDFGDLYGTIIDANPDLPQDQQWQIHCRTAEVDQTNKVTLWPARFSWEELKAMERSMGPGLYSAQMLNHPIPASGGLATLEDLKDQWWPRRTINALLPNLNLHCTVDMAAMDAKKEGGDFIVLNVSGFDRQGRMIIVDIRRGHFNEMEVINHFFDIAKMYPKLLDFKVEKEAYWRTLAPFLKREQERRGRYLPPIIDIKRDNSTSKQERIRGLQPWFKAHLLFFPADLACRTDLFQEITRFPSRGVHDDILDTLADQLQNREGGVNYDVVPAPWEPRFGESYGDPDKDKFIEFDPITHEATFLRQQIGEANVCYDANGI